LSVSSDADLLRARFTLADAQFIIAREHGFDNWSKLAAHIESMMGQVPSSEIWRRGERAVVKGDVSTLDALLRDHGEMLRTGPVQSTWWGGLAPDYSKGDARAIVAREHHFDSWDQFAGFVEALSDRRSPVAQFEAAVDAVVTGDEATHERLIHGNPDLIRARSIRKHHSSLLHYVGANGVEGFRQRTPKNAVKIAEILLNAGADVDARADMYGGSDTLGLVATSIHPVTARVQEELLAFLLARGASVGTAKGVDAWSSLINGCHANGREKAAQFLAERAPALDLEAAAGVGRVDVVKTFFTPDGKLRENTTEQQMKDGFTWACEYGRTEVVAFLLQKGMAVAAKLRHHGQTGLHWAAYGAHPDMLRVLLQWQAPVTATDDAFDGTPLGWALYAWAGGGPHAGSDRYYQVVNLLIGAGATVDQEWLADSERGLPLATKIREDARMRAALGTRR
jgi:ankyrin repeat protein